LGADGSSLVLQLFGDQSVEQHGVLQPAAVVLLEEISHDVTAGSLIGVNSDEARTLVGGPHNPFGQKAPNVVRLLVVGPLHGLPHLLCGARDYAEQSPQRADWTAKLRKLLGII
jgi:hypothetical protein